MKFSKILSGIFALLVITLISTAFANEVEVKIYTDVELYNKAQHDNAVKFYINDEHQSEGTCVCNTMMNMEIALTGKVKSFAEYEAQIGGCSTSFGDSYNYFKDRHSGEVFGGESTMFGRHEMVSTDAAIERIVEAIDDGRVVSVGLSAKPIYDEYAENNNTVYSGAGFAARHAIMVIGLYRNVSGQVSNLIVADSSGPKRKYVVSAKAFRKSYDLIRVRPSRGVYIPDQRINQPIRYSQD